VAVSVGAASATPAAAVSIRALSKRYGGALAVDAVSLDVDTGEIHGIVGENGAGKSTILGILSGRTAPSAGDVQVFGTELPVGSPRSSHRLGIAAIYQELTMVPALSAEANVFLGQELGHGPLLDKQAMRRTFVQLCSELAVEIDPAAAVRDLPIAKQQIVEIMRAMHADARILLFDEPTAALPEHERESALALIRKLRAEGHTVVFVSHHLDEVLSLCDRVSVMRNGRLVETRPSRGWTKATLVRAMVGRDVAVNVRRRPLQGGVPLLRAERICVPGRVQDISLVVHAGQIVGLAGLVGSGRTTVLRALAGMEPTSTGRLWLDGVEGSWPRDVPAALGQGIALIPEDRKRQGLILGMTVADNVTMPDLRSVSRWGLVMRRRQRSTATRALARLDVPDWATSMAVGNLSGGNQQRVLIAKWLYRVPRVLLADEPTRGIDIAAKAEVLNCLQDLAGQDLGLVIASSELDEVLTVSDRVVVLADGVLVEEFDNHDGHLKGSDILHRAFRLPSP